MYRKLFFILSFLAFIAPKAMAQFLCPVHFQYYAKKTAPGEWVIYFEGQIQEHWHLYSQKTYPPNAIAPFPSAISVDSSDINNTKIATFIGTAEEVGNKIIKKEPLFDDAIIEWFEGTVTFKQKVKINNPNDTLHGLLEYMTCDDKQCIMGEPVTWAIKFDETLNKTPLVYFSTKDCPSINAATVPTSVEPTDSSSKKKISYKTCDTLSEPKEEKSGLLWLFILGIGGGLLALIMPCTFPMIPMTVSFFLKRNKDRKGAIREAIIYGLSIILIYTIPTAIIAYSLGSDALNAMASSVFFNLLFFAVFVYFAFSMFGYYEINMPSWLVNKSDKMGDSSGLAGIFFMAFTLALVSFSCTGPVLGSFLVAATTQGNYLDLIIVMLGFSTAMAVPFALFAMFPTMLQSLPKSGAWMTTVKVVFGLIELAFALKFLSNIDLAYHWGIIKLELFLGIWAGISIFTGLYLLDKVNIFPHDSKSEKLSPARIALALVFFVFGGYCAYGITGSNLSLISGFPPPSYYTFKKQAHDCPSGLTCFKNYDEGIAAAKIANKPIMIDFTGYSCVNCRKMEDNVWVQPDIFQLINDNYTLISLYVDDKAKLPEAEQYIDAISQKKVTTWGQKWSYLQRDMIQTNAQPYYVITNHTAQLLAPPSAYEPNVAKYKAFLECGIKNF